MTALSPPIVYPPRGGLPVLLSVPHSGRDYPGWLVDMAVVLPVTITLLLAVGVVGVYALAILQPYFSTLNEMTQWSWH